MHNSKVKQYVGSLPFHLTPYHKEFYEFHKNIRKKKFKCFQRIMPPIWKAKKIPPASGQQDQQIKQIREYFIRQLNFSLMPQLSNKKGVQRYQRNRHHQKQMPLHLRLGKDKPSKSLKYQSEHYVYQQDEQTKEATNHIHLRKQRARNKLNSDLYQKQIQKKGEMLNQNRVINEQLIERKNKVKQGVRLLKRKFGPPRYNLSALSLQKQSSPRRHNLSSILTADQSRLLKNSSLLEINTSLDLSLRRLNTVNSQQEKNLYGQQKLSTSNEEQDLSHQRGSLEHCRTYNQQLLKRMIDLLNKKQREGFLSQIKHTNRQHQ